MGSVPALWSTFEYPLARYPFPTLVAQALGVPALTGLAGDGPRWTRHTDQTSGWHRRFYDSFQHWRSVYRGFVRDLVAPRLGEPVYYQAIPTFRVHQPDNVAVGEFHTDAEYHHPRGEITFWLPLTAAFGTNSVWVEDDDGRLHPFVANPGEVVEFAAVSRRHGNLVNTTGKARASFDFRCLPVRRWGKEPPGRSVHAGLRFVPGEYYDAIPVGGGAG